MSHGDPFVTWAIATLVLYAIMGMLLAALAYARYRIARNDAAGAKLDRVVDDLRKEMCR